VGLFSLLAWDGSAFIVQQVDPTATLAVRHRFVRYDSTLTVPVARLDFDQSDLPPLDANLIPENVKAQAITSWRGGYAIGYGTTHVDGQAENPSHLSGIRIFDEQGRRVQSALMHPEMYIDILRAAGTRVDLIENEGLVGFEGALYGLWVTSSHANVGAYGILITQELVGDIDCRSAAATEWNVLPPTTAPGEGTGVLPGVDPTGGSAGNLVGNPGFERGLRGWRAAEKTRVTLERSRVGHRGSWSSRLERAKGTRAMTLDDSPNWVPTSTAGTYTGSLWVRSSQPGSKLVLRLREFRGKDKIGRSRARIELTGRWRRVTTSLVARAPGSSTIDFSAVVRSAEPHASFWADDARLTVS
jgi:hypothetical protein